MYIDGYNLYYRALKDGPFRWLDLSTLAETLFPEDTIHRVCYFTARLGARPGNPSQPRRQLVYLRALATLPRVEIHYGAFRSGFKRRPLAEPVAGLPNYVLIRESDEKGSDVNLATRLLVDGFDGDYEHAVVVSNDADSAAAMRYVRHGLNRRVTLVNPDRRNTSPRELAESATYVKRLWKSHLRNSQFPETLRDEDRSHHQTARLVTETVTSGSGVSDGDDKSSDHQRGGVVLTPTVGPGDPRPLNTPSHHPVPHRRTVFTRSAAAWVR